MPRSSRDEEFSAFVQTRRTGLVRSACLLTAGDTHLAEDLVRRGLARLYVAWPKVRKAGTESGYVWRIIVNAHIDEVRRPSRRRERHMPELPEARALPEAVTDGLGGALVPLALSGSSAVTTTQKPIATSSSPQPSQARPHSVGPQPQSRQIKLVAWKGTQPPGYRVSWMPKGWVVQGSTPLALVIAPPSAPDKNPDVYIGKLVVMLQSRDATAPPADWASQPVNGLPGRFDVQGGTQILTFRIAGGQWVVIQAPVSLGWDSAELAKFASGVQVLVTAQQGRG